ncbi:MAG: arginase [Bacilli bacterium]|nr:arginase [Bacilli bacterium]MDD4733733.1 arginase [Bacilli bacterium]
MKYNIINAESELGVHVNGAEKGPFLISKFFDNVINIPKIQYKKSYDKFDLAKNLNYINEYNELLYNKIISNDNFIITLGGDHSVAIASALASIKKRKNLGIIWIDSHGDYNNFNTTITGNLHGLPFAAITNYKNTELLTKFHEDNFFKSQNAVLIGARDLDELEILNLKDAGITIFSTKDIKNKGVEFVMNEAFKIASKDTEGVHISYDLDVIDPKIAKGVSIPAKDGITEVEAYSIMNEIKKNKNLVKSLDLVEYNPNFDEDSKTLKIAVNLLNIYIEKK